MLIIEKTADKRRRLINGAGDEARTRYLHLGKVALYQMSYARNSTVYYSRLSLFVNPHFPKKRGIPLRFFSLKKRRPGRIIPPAGWISRTFAPVMELADMRDLGSRAERRAGSSPFRRTRKPGRRSSVSPVFSFPYSSGSPIPSASRRRQRNANSHAGSLPQFSSSSLFSLRFPTRLSKTANNFTRPFFPLRLSSML